MKIVYVTLVALQISVGSTGCSKRQIVPVAFAGTGAALMTGGFVYRATLPAEDSDELFGDEPRQKAGTAVLIFSGAALVLTGVIWSIATPLCEVDADCWARDVCDTASSTCVPRPASVDPQDDEP
jgi:hypothetical protein